MSQEELFARQICRVLDRGTQTLDPVIVERLRAIRERALQHQRVRVYEPALAGAGGPTLPEREGERHLLPTWLAMLALVLGVVTAYVWNGFDKATEYEVIDSALLADDLPPNAYLDKGFQAWLEKDASASD